MDENQRSSSNNSSGLVKHMHVSIPTSPSFVAKPAYSSAFAHVRAYGSFVKIGRLQYAFSRTPFRQSCLTFAPIASLPAATVVCMVTNADMCRNPADNSCVVCNLHHRVGIVCSQGVRGVKLDSSLREESWKVLQIEGDRDPACATTMRANI